MLADAFEISESLIRNFVVEGRMIIPVYELDF